MNSHPNTSPAADTTEFIDTHRYTPVRKKGQGYWGTVWEALDTLDVDSKGRPKRVAIKRLTPNDVAQQQMKDRGLDLYGAMQKEAGFLPSRNVVPRHIDLDSKGEPYIVMPYFEQTLQETLHYGKSLPQRQAFLSDVSAGLAELHGIHRRVHADLKLDNILVDHSNTAMITDLGTSSFASQSVWSEDRRDNMGYVQTRAPELYIEGNHPSEQSDVYSLGVIAYRLLHPKDKYPFETELSQTNPKDFFGRQTKTSFDTLVKQKVKELPREYRQLVRESLSLSPTSRPLDGKYFDKALKKIVYLQDPKHRVTRILKNAALRIAVPALLTMGSFWAGFGLRYDDPHYRPTEIKGPLYLPRDPNEQTYKFDTEPFFFDGTLPDRGNYDYIFINNHALEGTKNDRALAHLLVMYRYALDSYFRSGGATTEFQDKLWSQYLENMQSTNYNKMDSNLFTIAGNALRECLPQVKRADGSYDLEDLLCLSRVGYEAFYRAKTVSNSNDYRTYSKAIDPITNKPIISLNEKGFIDTWLKFVHAGNSINDYDVVVSASGPVPIRVPKKSK